jgi:hypothetical protein
MKNNLKVLTGIAAASILAVAGVVIGANNGFINSGVAATGTANSVVIRTQATAGSGNLDLATTGTTSHVAGTYTTMLDLLDTGYDFTAGSGANINFAITGTIVSFTYSGTAHGNNEVLDVWAKASSGDGETLCYRCNKGDGKSWYGGQAGNAAVEGATDDCEHIATISDKHFFRFNVWSAGGTSMSIKNLTISWTC